MTAKEKLYNYIARLSGESLRYAAEKLVSSLSEKDCEFHLWFYNVERLKDESDEINDLTGIIQPPICSRCTTEVDTTDALTGLCINCM